MWHGRGSIHAEQQAALKYAQTLASSSEHVVEMGEDESQADEMFWMILGEGDYARADYWQWRASAPTTLNPRAWVVDAKQGTEAVRSQACRLLRRHLTLSHCRSSQFPHSRRSSSSITPYTSSTAFGSCTSWLAAKRAGADSRFVWPYLSPGYVTPLVIETRSTIDAGLFIGTGTESVFGAAIQASCSRPRVPYSDTH